LLDHYIRAQKLALTIIRDFHKHCREQAFNKWKLAVKDDVKVENTLEIREAVE